MKYRITSASSHPRIFGFSAEPGINEPPIESLLSGWQGRSAPLLSRTAIPRALPRLPTNLGSQRSHVSRRYYGPGSNQCALQPGQPWTFGNADQESIASAVSSVNLSTLKRVQFETHDPVHWRSSKAPDTRRLWSKRRNSGFRTGRGLIHHNRKGRVSRDLGFKNC